MSVPDEISCLQFWHFLYVKAGKSASSWNKTAQKEEIALNDAFYKKRFRSLSSRLYRDKWSDRANPRLMAWFSDKASDWVFYFGRAIPKLVWFDQHRVLYQVSMRWPLNFVIKHVRCNGSLQQQIISAVLWYYFAESLSFRKFFSCFTFDARVDFQSIVYSFNLGLTYLLT